MANTIVSRAIAIAGTQAATNQANKDNK